MNHSQEKYSLEKYSIADLLSLRVYDLIVLLRDATSNVPIEVPVEPPKAEQPPEPVPVPDEPPAAEPVGPPVDVPPALPIEPPEEPPIEPTTPPEAPVEPPVIVPPSDIPPATEEPPVQPVRDGIVPVAFKNTSTTPQQNVPVTFGQVFGEGDILPSQAIALQAEDGSIVDCQIDVKATHNDGSVRHAVLSAILPTLTAVDDYKIVVPSVVSNKAAPEISLATGTEVAIVLDGKSYKVAADNLLDKIDRVWLDGNLVKEVHTHSAMIAEDGVGHPHLTARFAIRADATGNARVDIALENNWAYEPAPGNFTYDLTVSVGGKVVFEEAAREHFHQARWRKIFWTGGEPAVHVMHDSAYIMATCAVGNYDPSITIDDDYLERFAKNWTGGATEIMGVGLSVRAMPTTGGRPDIGMLPDWAVAYLLSMDERAKKVTLGTADLAGSWSMHFRDKNTDMPISLLDYPCMTILGKSTDTKNPLTGKYEAFPKGTGTTPYQHDSSHQPSFAYLPYLVTGDHYYLEELQFWAMWNVFSTNPGYRQREKGLVQSGQIRAQAWSMRTLCDAAYITPDNHRLKSHFNQILDSNLDWYNEQYSFNPDANKLGFLINGPAVIYASKRGVGPWQDDFFTAVIGTIADRGYTKAIPLLMYKLNFPVERMIGEGVNPVFGASYNLIVRDTPTSPLYDNIAQAYAATVGPKVAALGGDDEAIAKVMKLDVGEMTGYSKSVTGFPSNMQPALAYAADYLGERGKKAWKKFMERSVKPDYSKGAQWAMWPRTAVE